LIWRFVFVVSL
jgi:hypothetical protein